MKNPTCPSRECKCASCVEYQRKAHENFRATFRQEPRAKLEKIAKQNPGKSRERQELVELAKEILKELDT